MLRERNGGSWSGYVATGFFGGAYFLPSFDDYLKLLRPYFGTNYSDLSQPKGSSPSTTDGSSMRLTTHIAWRSQSNLPLLRFCDAVGFVSHRPP